MDPGLFARGGGQGLAAIKTALTFFFVVVVLVSFSPQLILQFNTGLSMVCFKENTIMLQGFRGVQHFPGMVTFFRGGGGQKTNFYRNTYNL